MFKKIIIITTTTLLIACNATMAPPYEADKAPEDREDYTGAKGMVQYQKDQNYLAKKELADKCEQARIDLAVAKTEENQEQMQKQQAIIERNCV